MTSEVHWPCQRLRIGFGAVLFFLFETLIGQQLPESLRFMILGLGVACLISAYQAIRTWRLLASLEVLKLAIRASPYGAEPHS